LQYVRIYEDHDGLSHFGDVDVPLSLADFAPPAPPLLVSTVTPATGAGFVTFPAGWRGDWHPAPRRQVFYVLAGEIEAETGDGETRRFGPGSVVLVEDVTGRGHCSRVVGDVDVVAGVVHLPE
jgi:mannose-6-phosphate isomerase-like protein (cupin superfamily)